MPKHFGNWHCQRSKGSASGSTTVTHLQRAGKRADGPPLPHAHLVGCPDRPLTGTAFLPTPGEAGRAWPEQGHQGAGWVECGVKGGGGAPEPPRGRPGLPFSVLHAASQRQGSCLSYPASLPPLLLARLPNDNLCCPHPATWSETPDVPQRGLVQTARTQQTFTVFLCARLQVRRSGQCPEQGSPGAALRPLW